jgi:alpha-galactosidase
VAVTALAASALVASSPSAGAAAPDSAAAAAPTLDAPAPTPPMGWNSWNTFGCTIDEARVEAAADAMVSSGMRDVGYEYVVVDDCWMQGQRDAAGNLVADSAAFPSGMKALGDYIHARGLKFGIYHAPREKTCAQYFNSGRGATSSYGFETQDAQLFASWGVDFVKHDWCDPRGTITEQRDTYEKFYDALKATGRPIVLSINTNSAHSNNGPDYDWGEVSNMWRTTEDITDAWSSGCRPTQDCFLGVTEILDVMAPLHERNRPNHYNDPDMLEVGVRGTLSNIENRAHIAMWAMLSSPLMAGNDITTMNDGVRDVLTAPDVIALNQDPLADQAQRIVDNGDTEVWVKQLADGSRAVALLNRGQAPVTMSTTAATIGMPASSTGYTTTEVWSDAVEHTTGTISAAVPRHGAAVFRVRAGQSVPATVLQLRNPASGLCVDSAESYPVCATATALRDCGRSPVQEFSATGGTLQFGGFCLDVDRAGTADGTDVISWECNAQQNQQWTLAADGTIRAAGSGKCLTARGTSSGSRLEIRTCSGAASQQFPRPVVEEPPTTGGGTGTGAGSGTGTGGTSPAAPTPATPTVTAPAAPTVPAAAAAQSTRVELRASGTRQRAGASKAQRIRLKVAVSSVSGRPAAGTLTLVEKAGKKTRTWGTVTLSNGRATLVLPGRLSVGRHVLKVVFTPAAGSAYAASTSKALRVRVTP